jgi:type II secretory pathway component GspD/PulD (secretin)
MKKTVHLILLACMASVLAVHAQTNSTPQDQPATNSADNSAQAAARAALQQTLNPSQADTATNEVNAAATTTNSVTTVTTAATTNSVATVVTTNDAATVTATNGATTVATTNSVTTVATTETVTSPATNVTTVEAPPVEVVPAAVPVAPAVAVGIPLIQFSDVPLTTAIENLARQAGINYMLDPKIAYGEPDQNGVVKAEPVLSIRWENITAENALLALLDNYGLQLIRTQNTGIARITIKDPSAPPPLTTRVLQLKYASVSNMVEAIRSTLTDKRSKVIADNRTSQLVLVATDPEQDAVDILIEQLDKPTRQVLIETKFVEISSNPTSQKGIDWTSTLQAQHIAYGNNLTAAQTTIAPGFPGPATSITSGTSNTNGSGSTSTTVVSGLAQELGVPGIVADTANGFGSMGFLNADGLNVVLSFLNSSSDAEVISTPRLVTLDNESARITVTEGFPVFNVTAGTANTTGGSQVSYTNVGTILDVTPRISANDNILLHVSPVVSSFAGIQSQTVGGLTYQADLFDFRSFDTRVLVPNAHTLVMGGMVSDNPQSTTTKVPLLGDIPYLGYAFRSESKSVTKDNLLVFITPTIVKDSDFRATDTQFLSSQPYKRDQMLNPNSLWDGTHPYNWSNPTNTDPSQALFIDKSSQ